LSRDWRFMDLGDLPPVSTQVVYHAVAEAVDKGASPNTIIFCCPNSPFVCLGYHQELDVEIDVEYCRLRGLPIVRRILGGGAVYLDRDQLFYQVVACKFDPDVPGSIQGAFRKYLEAPVKTYNDIGIRASYRPVNDVEVDGRKISGSGATEVGSSLILTGNMIFDFNFDEMARILKVPSEKFRDKAAKTLRERLTTMKKELAEPPSEELVRQLLRRNYELTLNVELRDGRLSSEELNRIRDLERQYSSPDWLHLVENEHEELVQRRNLKITGRSFLGEAVQKTVGGLLRVLVETLDNKISEIMITGDFSFIPRDHLKTLERELQGTEVAEEILTERILRIYEEYSIESPGLTAEDIAGAVAAAASGKS
jgi:lipoate-protein ligase A